MSDIYPKNFIGSRSFPKVKRAFCFVLMPFDPLFDVVYETLCLCIQSPELNLICRRADNIRSSNVLETILRGIAQSEYVIADLTASNPNVSYELGIAHCIKEQEKVVLLAQHLDFIPFDLRHLRFILYANNPVGRAALREELIATFQHVSQDSYRFRVYEGKQFHFGKKLVGTNSDLFELTFECAHIGHGAVKLLIHFQELTIDKPKRKVESQFLFLSDNQSTVGVQNIPWDLHLAESIGQGALLTLERQK